MDVTKIVAKMRLVYHSNAIDFVNVANQLHLLKDEKANLKNKNHLKECLDFYDLLVYKLPKNLYNSKMTNKKSKDWSLRKLRLFLFLLS